MKLRVERYNSLCGPAYTHRCIDNEGQEHNVDLLVNGNFPKDIDPELFVGKTIEVERLCSYTEIGINVKIIEKNNL